MQIQNPDKQMPKISESAWISETAAIVGNVTIEDDVFVAPNAVIRADEPGSSIVVSKGCNVQDNVVIHSLSNSEVRIGRETSLAHGCIVHGPCLVEEGCFVGFGSVVFDCNVGKGSVILHNSTIHGTDIPEGKVVQCGQTITTGAKVNDLDNITSELADFKRSVINANVELLNGYRNMDVQN
ncbi:carbonate dehydratase [Methanococcoides methylutens]|uniref:carbonate dehydratase n=1 Tax=Methanococcoides methylutens TaxID=2226 RepID=UPI0040449F6C